MFDFILLMGRASSFMGSTEYSTDKCCFPTGGGWIKVSHKILLLSFRRSWKRFVLLLVPLFIALIYCDSLLIWCFEVVGFLFFWWGEKYVQTLPVCFALIHVSPLFRSVRIRITWGVWKHTDTLVPELHSQMRMPRR